VISDESVIHSNDPNLVNVVPNVQENNGQYPMFAPVDNAQNTFLVPVQAVPQQPMYYYPTAVPQVQQQPQVAIQPQIQAQPGYGVVYLPANPVQYQGPVIRSNSNQIAYPVFGSN